MSGKEYSGMLCGANCSSLRDMWRGLAHPWDLFSTFSLSMHLILAFESLYVTMHTLRRLLSVSYLPELTDVRMCLVNSQLAGSSAIVGTGVTLVHKVGTVLPGTLAACC
jgi:hypothetical protein